MRLLSIVWPLLLSGLLCACPGRNTRRVVGPPKIELPTNGDAQARALFDEHRAAFERDGEVANSEAFEAIVRDYPDDPIVPHALLYGAMADVRANEHAQALEKLDQVLATQPADANLRDRARLFRGLALSSLDRNGEAFDDLSAGARALNQGDVAEMTFWNLAMAEASVLKQDEARALLYYDAAWSGARKAEKAYIRDRISSLSGGLTVAEMQNVLTTIGKLEGPAAAILGQRVAQHMDETGDGEGAKTLRARIQAARVELGMIDVLGPSGPGNPQLIGALLPMSGRLNRVGELCMRALVLASNRYPGGQREAGEASDFDLVARDSASAGSIADSMHRLVADDVLGVIGPFDSTALSEAASAADTLGLPLITLAPRGGSGARVFSIRHTAEQRARSLARHAFKAGVRDFAIFKPKNPYGSVVGGAFRQEVEKLGGSIVVEVEYAPGTTSFKEDVDKLKKPWSAVFVPDLAKNLQLVAPAFAAANLNAVPRGQKARHGRSVLLLSTAEGIDADYLRAAGRYSFGAVLAPGFFPDRTDDVIADFVSRYVNEFGDEPGAHEAYAYDAALALRHAVDQGHQTRAEVDAALRSQEVAGLTGWVRFDAQGQRADEGLLFEVQQPLAGQFELKALR